MAYISQAAHAQIGNDHIQTYLEMIPPALPMETAGIRFTYQPVL